MVGAQREVGQSGYIPEQTKKANVLRSCFTPKPKGEGYRVTALYLFASIGWLISIF